MTSTHSSNLEMDENNNNNTSKRCGDVPEELVSHFSNISIEHTKIDDIDQHCNKEQHEMSGGVENNPFKRLKTHTGNDQCPCAWGRDGHGQEQPQQQSMADADVVIEGSVDDYYPIGLGGDPGPNPHLPPPMATNDNATERDDPHYYSEDSFDSFGGDDFDF